MGFDKKVRFELRFEKGEVISQVDIWGMCLRQEKNKIKVFIEEGCRIVLGSSQQVSLIELKEEKGIVELKGCQRNKGSQIIKVVGIQ